MSLQPEKLKKDFPALEQNELVYLDNAATTQKPDQVIDRIQRFYEKENANVGRGLYDLASTATQEYRKARRKVADFIGAGSEELVFVRNTTEATNLLANALELEGKIVLSEMAHHSEQLPWREHTENKVEYIQTKNYRLDLEAAEEIIDKDTALVEVPHVSNVFGGENDVKKLAELAHRNDAYIVVDGAQSVPHMPVDMNNLGVDFLTFSGHKILGPMGIGGLYGRKELLEEMQPYQVGGGMIRKVKKDRIEYEKPPSKFEAGTPNVAGAVGLAEAVRYLQDAGMDEIHRHEKQLSAFMAKELEDIKGVKVLAPDEHSLVSFKTDFAHPHDVAEILNQNNIAVRAGHHCAQPQMEALGISGGTVRASPYLYNTQEDVEKLVEAVKEVREVFS